METVVMSPVASQSYKDATTSLSFTFHKDLAVYLYNPAIPTDTYDGTKMLKDIRRLTSIHCPIATPNMPCHETVFQTRQAMADHVAKQHKQYFW